MTKWYRRLLIGLLILMFGACVRGGIGLVINGLGLPKTFLIHSPFKSYFWPGVILIGVIGGTQVLAAVALVTKKTWGERAAAVAGFGLLIWIFTEIYMLKETMVLQAICFGYGISELILAWLVEEGNKT